VNGSANNWRLECRALAGLALPLVAGNLAWSGIAAIDLFLLGRVGPDAVAAGALALAIHNLFFIFGIGLASAASPLVAQARGARLHAVRQSRRTTRAALHGVSLLCLPAWTILWRAEPILRAMGQQPKLAHDAALLLHGLQWSLWPWLAFAVLRNVVSAWERPGWAMAVLALGLPFNLLAGWALIFGRLGLPAWGLFGAGLASTASGLFVAGALAAVLVLDRRFRRLHLFGRWWQPVSAALARVGAVGLPVAVAQTLEVAVFNAAVILMGLIGRDALAAHAAAIQIAALSFMVPLGLAQAASVRVGLAFGRGDRAATARAGWTALMLGTGYAVVAALPLLGAGRPLVGLFLDLHATADRPVVTLAIHMLVVAAAFQLVDCAQAIASGALRGLGDTRVPMLVAAFGYWVVGIGVGVALAFPLRLGGVGIWIGLASGLATVAALLVRRWARFTRSAPPGSLQRTATPASAPAC
jgi:MATE family multidrug resistance protein